MSAPQRPEEITRRGRFTAEEDAFILANANSMSILEMARHLGRWASSVGGRLQKLRGKKRVMTYARPPRGTGTYETVAVGDVVDVDRHGPDKRRRDGEGRPTRGVVVGKYPHFAVVRFHHRDTRRAYCEAFGYEALTVEREVARRAAS